MGSNRVFTVATISSALETLLCQVSVVVKTAVFCHKVA
jgi:hypothetical protein